MKNDEKTGTGCKTDTRFYTRNPCDPRRLPFHERFCHHSPIRGHAYEIHTRRETRNVDLGGDLIGRDESRPYGGDDFTIDVNHLDSRTLYIIHCTLYIDNVLRRVRVHHDIQLVAFGTQHAGIRVRDLRTLGGCGSGDVDVVDVVRAVGQRGTALHGVTEGDTAT